jgi:hypothetical protein
MVSSFAIDSSEETSYAPAAPQGVSENWSLKIQQSAISHQHSAKHRKPLRPSAYWDWDWVTLGPPLGHPSVTQGPPKGRVREVSLFATKSKKSRVGCRIAEIAEIAAVAREREKQNPYQ